MPAGSPAQRTHARLRRNELSVVDIAVSTMANVGPAFSFYFGFAGIVAVSGIASPLTVLVAAVAIALLGNTLAGFSREMPSTGSFVSFIGRSMGPLAGVAAGVTIIIGYIIAISGVVAASGQISHILFNDYLHVDISWKVFGLLFTAIALYLMITGVKTSTRWAGIFFVVEMLVLLVVAAILLIKHSGSLSLAPFNPANLTGGSKGLGLGFPLAVFLFVGWENSAALAEETRQPRRDIPRAIFFSIGLMAVAYLVLSFASIVGFDQNPAAVAKADIPYIDLAKGVGGFVGFIAVVAGFTSTLGVLIAASNSQARLLFNAGREGLLPAVLGRVTRKGQTPWVAFVTFFAIGLAIVYAYGWNKDAVLVFAELATMGTILIVLVYLVANIALPIYMFRRHRDRVHPIRHVLLPLLGAASLIYPIYALVQPGQEAPYKYFPLVAAAVLLVALVYAAVMTARDRSLGERIGSIIADHD
ncbi:MAG: APC family permease [Candidatus Dormibacteraeota bacterium]|uniref:APC family permease n=1 Tax=Candidatus Amunia macphersoniae TaxID=3127014 RepID=A0A934N8S0_9BACT|nr:APC family permease [Candidatus Dormibacteraeota bacterium]